MSHLKVSAVPPDGAIVDKDLGALGDAVSAEGEVARGEVGHVEGAGQDVAVALLQHRHEVVKLLLKVKYINKSTG